MADFLFEFEIPDLDEIMDDGRRLLLEKVVKSNGIWQIHKFDKDDQFPSDFHAHNVEAAEKLDVYTGNIYDARTKQIVRKLPKKAMLYIYNQLARCKEETIVLKCQDKSRFNFF